MTEAARSRSGANPRLTTTPKGARLWARDPHDWYVEPIAATTALLRAERFTGPVWDPACGRGHVVDACRQAGLEAAGSDIVRRVGPETPWWRGERDFLQTPPGALEEIITNPPYFRGRGSEGFTRHALQVARRKVAVFSTIGFLAGERRARGLWREHPPHRVWILTPRPSVPPGVFLEGGGKAESDSRDFVWSVWDLRRRPATAPVLGWLYEPKAAA